MASTKAHPYSRGEKLDSTFWWKTLQVLKEYTDLHILLCLIPFFFYFFCLGKYNLSQEITWGKHKSSNHDPGMLEQQWRSLMVLLQHERGQWNSRRMKGLSAHHEHLPVPATQEGKDSGSRSLGNGTWAKGSTILVHGVIPFSAGGAWKMWATHQWPSTRTWRMLIRAMDTQTWDHCQEDTSGSFHYHSWNLSEPGSGKRGLPVVFPWRRTWQPTPVFLPGESPWTGRSLAGYSPWGHRELDTTEQLSIAQLCFKPNSTRKVLKVNCIFW